MTRKGWTLLAVNIAVFMLLLDITAVNTALPAIRRDLDATFSDLQWVIDAYALTLAALVLSAGSVADRLGRRRLFAAGLTIFVGSSVLAGLAADATSLVLARAVQGIGGAIILAVSLALIAEEFQPGEDRRMALAVYGATIGLAVGLGAVVGGAIVDGLGWEYVFFLKVPTGLVVIVITYLRLRESRDPNATRVDWAGVCTFGVATLGLVMALVRGNEAGWGSASIVALFAIAGAALAVFVFVERRAPEPMLPLELFRRPAFTGAQVATFSLSTAVFGMFLYITLYLQNYLGYSPLQAGLRGLPLTLTSVLTAMATKALLGWLPARALIAGGLCMVGAGLIWMSGVTAYDDWTGLLGGLLTAGAGVGLLNSAIPHVALRTVRREQSGMAAGINNTFRQLGMAVGIALWGAVLLTRGTGRAAEIVGGSSERSRQLVEGVSSGDLGQVLAPLPPGLREEAAAAARSGFLSGLNDILVLGAVVAFVGVVLTFWLVREPAVAEQPVAARESVPAS